MASGGPENEVSDVAHELQDICLITGCSEERGRSLLEACNFDLQMAINLQLESVEPQPPVAHGPPQVAQVLNPDAEDFVRAPILPREDILVNSVEAHNMNRGNGMKRNGAPMSVFEAFRDFQVETNQQEEQMMQGMTRVGGKMRRLEDLFRPPLEMMFHGTFQMARDAGIATNKWLMVNPQNSREFQCQILNRDIWSDAAIKSIIQEHFIFWQVYVNSSEGQQYNQYYHVDRFPYVSVVDPRTGELMKKWHSFEKQVFAEQLLQFLTEHPLPANQSPESSHSESRVGQEPPRVEVMSTSATSQSRNNYSETATVPRDNCFPFSSPTQYAPKVRTLAKEAAVKVESTITSKPHANGNAELFALVYDKRPMFGNPEIKKKKLGGECDKMGEASSSSQSIANGPPTSLSLRFPDSTREIVKFPSDSKLQLLQSMLDSRGYPANKYQYMTYYPKRVLSTPELSQSTFSSLGIVHNDTIFVHAMDEDADAK